MLGRPTFRRVRAHARRGAAWSVSSAVLAFGIVSPFEWGCFPEQALSSYMDGARSNAAVVTGTNRNLVDAGTGAGAAPRDAGSPSAVEPEASGEGETPDADAAPAPRLVCRDECVCEPQAALEFMFCAPPVTRAVAVERCAGAGGSLVSIDDEARNAWLSERMQALDADDFWLSGTDEDTEGVWLWGDGRVFYGGDAGVGGFVPWDEGQPNDVNDEDCMRAAAGVWRDLDCADEIAYVCQG
jgi:hypothetical protein